MTKSPNLNVSERIPVSTYRLQLNKHFTLEHARSILGYLKQLGISDCYSSPVLKARAGSVHCYDVTDHKRINPEIGSLAEFRSFTSEIKKRRMGLLLDIVPNHMAMSDENQLWMNVLEYGPASKYSDYFDIRWQSEIEPLKNKVLLPILGNEYREALSSHDIELVFSGGAFMFKLYNSIHLPLTPKSYASLLNLVKDRLVNDVGMPFALRKINHLIGALRELPDVKEVTKEDLLSLAHKARLQKSILRRLYESYPQFIRAINAAVDLFNGYKSAIRYKEFDSILGEQFYDLSYWKDATKRINYRRFFIINDLVALHQENPIVFEETHELILRSIAQGRITGLRVDHPDGLWDPASYFDRLQRRCQGSKNSEIRRPNIDPKGHKALSHPFYVVAEKILEQSESLPNDWRVDGTTGYDFLRDLNGIFIEKDNEKTFDEIYFHFTHKRSIFEDIAYSEKKRVIQYSMKSELNLLAKLLSEISQNSSKDRTFSPADAARIIEEVTACFPVYRTYISEKRNGISKGQQYVEFALASARLRARRSRSKIKKLDLGIFDLLGQVLKLNLPKPSSVQEKRKWISFVMKFQQFTAPVMAKGVEDAAFYVFNRLVSLNEVGSDPSVFGISVEEFHDCNIGRANKRPHSMLTTSTHDTKRSEDVRARINVLSEIPERWESSLRRWSHINRKAKLSLSGGKIAPSQNDEYHLYQTLIGSWPLGKLNKSSFEDFTERIVSYMRKATREGSENTDWVSPQLDYERALEQFIRKILGNSNRQTQFVKDFKELQRVTSYHGMLNSLSQLLLKLTSPGIPDTYQGTEIWSFSLVDPDNRRTVDFDGMARKLQELNRQIRSSENDPSVLTNQLLENMENGLIKMYVLHQVLQFRNKNRTLFRDGEYLPLNLAGSKRTHVCSFIRSAGNDSCVILAPRFYVKLLRGQKYSAEVWKDTKIHLTRGVASRRYHNIFTGETFSPFEEGRHVALSLEQVLGRFPIALLSSD